ncbi:MAG TPA: dynamin family protein [Anaeromyxobacteraceae bacterium]|nr:dynamin family protein [Anaeromyxobacteraceae bacterium]
MKIALQLLDRTLLIREDGVRTLSLGNGSEKPYDSVQDAVRLAVDVVLRHLNALDVSGGPDYERLPKIVDSGQLELELQGHERETYVAALHLWAAYGVATAGLPWAREGARCAVRTQADNGRSFYETYRFESDIAPIEVLAEKAATWRGLVAEEQPEERANEVYGEILRTLGVKEKDGGGSCLDQIRIGVLGVTGAGKSSFINALLQRYVAPRSEAICSACVVEFWEAASAEKEGFEVELLPVAMRDAMLKAAKHEHEVAEKRAGRIVQTTHASHEANENAAKQALDYVCRLEEAEKCVRLAEGKRLPLSAMPPFVSVVNDDLTHLLVSKVRVRLVHPLLRHVAVVDTPGLRDRDERRRRIAIAELATLDGWLYLSEGNTKFNVSVAADIDEIRAQANNGTGAIVLTKVDHIGSRGGTLFDDATNSLNQFRIPPVSWKNRVSWCAARAPALAVEILLKYQGGDAWAELHAEFEKYGVLNHANRMGDPCTYKATHRFRPARTLMDLVGVAGQEPQLQRGLLDYFLDASFVPATARGLAAVVNEQAIVCRVLRGKKMLLADVRSRIDACQVALKENRDHLENIDSVEKMQEQVVQVQKRIASLAISEAKLRESLLELERDAADRRRQKVEGGPAKAETLRSAMLQDLTAKVTKQAEWELMGDRSYSFFDSFDAKLAKWCSSQIQNFREELCKECGGRGMDAQAVQEATKFDVERYTLHRQPSDEDDVDDEEGLWESFEKTLARMARKAGRQSEKVEAKILGMFSNKLKEVARSICEAASAPLKGIQQEVIEAQASSEALDADIEKLKRGTPGSRELVKKRIGILENRLDDMQAFERALAPEASQATNKSLSASKRQEVQTPLRPQY